MKRCPTCDKTFADGMKFCQTDGTLLIEDAPPADPYKTVVGNQGDIASAFPPLDPFKTMVAPAPPKAEEDVLQLPDEADSLKTMVVSQEDLQNELKSGEADDVPKLDLPPLGGAVPIIEPKVGTPGDFSPATPKSGDPFSSPSNIGGSSEPALPKPLQPIADDSSTGMNSGVQTETPSSPFDSSPSPNDFSGQPPYGNQENKPIPSPFDGSMVGYQPPPAPPFDAPKPPPFQSSEPVFGGQQQQSPPFGQSPFQPPTPFGTAEPFNQPLQQAEWTPPPAPISEWQNQNIGANTPFQPPPAGQDQTLAIVSLVCGILGILCCGMLTGIPAIITGYMAKNNVDANPNQYSGRGMALAGMILGGVSVVLSIVVIILQVLFGVLSNM